MTTLTSRYRPATTLNFEIAKGSFEEVVVGIRVASTATSQLLQQQAGLDASTVILEARLVTPVRRPASLISGRKATLTYGGREGIATILPYEGAIPLKWRDRYGDKLMLAWHGSA